MVFRCLDILYPIATFFYAHLCHDPFPSAVFSPLLYSFHVRVACIYLLLPFVLESETGSHLAATLLQIHQRSFLLFNFYPPHFSFRFSFLFLFRFLFLLHAVLLSSPRFSNLPTYIRLTLPFLATTSTRVICACSLSISLYGFISSGQS